MWLDQLNYSTEIYTDILLISIGEVFQAVVVQGNETTFWITLSECKDVSPC